MSRPSNLRPTAADTPEARLSGVVINLIHKYRDEFDKAPDVADLCEVLRNPIRREILLAMLDEARGASISRGERIRSIVGELNEILLIEGAPDGS